jgi:hypothetical protein
MTLFMQNGEINSIAKADCPECCGEGFKFVLDYSDENYSCRYVPCNCIEVRGLAPEEPR